MCDLRLKLPFTLIISGPSRAGKSTCLQKLINSPECFTEPIKEIVYCYSKHTNIQPVIDRYITVLPITFNEGIPEDKILNRTLFKGDKGKLLVLDDCYTEPKQSKCLFELFNIISHHQNISVILTVQNLHGSTPNQRSSLNTLLRSCTYLVIFVNRRQTPVIHQLARTYFPGQKDKLIKPFNCILKNCIPYTYLFIDLQTDDEEYQVREGGLLTTDKCFIYNEED